jgi:hypothetical protein
VCFVELCEVRCVPICVCGARRVYVCVIGAWCIVHSVYFLCMFVCFCVCGCFCGCGVCVCGA